MYYTIGAESNYLFQLNNSQKLYLHIYIHIPLKKQDKCKQFESVMADIINIIGN
jgi:hypothetical protein